MSLVILTFPGAFAGKLVCYLIFPFFSRTQRFMDALLERQP